MQIAHSEDPVDQRIIRMAKRNLKPKYVVYESKDQKISATLQSQTQLARKTPTGMGSDILGDTERTDGKIIRPKFTIEKAEKA